jgi:hypothetical protein
MSLLMVLGVIGCKAETGTVMYVIKAPLPDDTCVYPELATEERFVGKFDPTVRSSLPTVFSVHNSLNAKDADQRVDDNGVNIRPDANHIQLDEARVCYYRTTDLTAVEEHDCDADTTICRPNEIENIDTPLQPCTQTQALFTMLLAESSSTPDTGRNVKIELLDLDVMRHLFGQSFNPEGIARKTDFSYSECKAVGVGLDSPSGDASCNVPSVERVWSPNRADSATNTGLYPDDQNFFSTGTGFDPERIVAKIVLSGQTVSGAEVTSSPFIFPVDIYPARAVAKAGGCVQERVICDEQQAKCEFQGASGNRKVGTCRSIVGSPSRYSGGCFLDGWQVFDAGDIETVPCRFGVNGGAPELTSCEPWALDGVDENYICKDENTCEQYTEIPVATGCGDGVVNGEACDDGFTDPCGTCNADCTAAGEVSTCGDGILCPETEECDAGPANGDGSSECEIDCTRSE